MNDLRHVVLAVLQRRKPTCEEILRLRIHQRRRTVLPNELEAVLEELLAEDVIAYHGPQGYQLL